MQKSRIIKTPQQKTKSFLKIIEAGDLALYEPFKQALAVFGYTKIGKTTLCHLITGAVLKSVDVGGDITLKAPQTVIQKNALIGSSMESQTEIPNVFHAKFKLKSEEIVDLSVLDQPGYGDTYGFHRIFSNGYFHYRTFSKTPKLKFLVAFSQNQLSGTTEYVKKTIQKFVSTFADFESEKESIMNATSFIVTKVDKNLTQKNIQDKFKRITEQATGNMTQKQIDTFLYVINSVLQNQLNDNKKSRVYLIFKPDKKDTSFQQSNHNMLQDIYESTRFWEREFSETKDVKMDKINFEVSQQILEKIRNSKNQLFNQEFYSFLNSMNERMKIFFDEDQYSFLKIYGYLVKDSECIVSQNKFLEVMGNFVKKYYPAFDNGYKKKRQEVEAILFKDNNLLNSSPNIKKKIIQNKKNGVKQPQIEISKKENHFAKKFKVLEFIEDKMSHLMNTFIDPRFQQKRSLTTLEELSYIFKQIFKCFDCLRTKKSDSQKIIYKYSYIMQRLLEELKITSIILFQNETIRQQFNKVSLSIAVSVDVIRYLGDHILNTIMDHQIEKKKMTFVEQIDLSIFENIDINPEMINFFESAKSGQLCQSVLMNKNLCKLVSRYAEQISVSNKSQDEKQFVLKKLLFYRTNFYDFFESSVKDVSSKQEYEESIEQLFQLTNLLAEILALLNHPDLARKVYKTVHNVHKVIESYEKELISRRNNWEKGLPSSQQKDYYRELLMSFGKYAQQNHRTQLAMKQFQQALSKSLKFSEIKEASESIIILGTKRNQIDLNSLEDPYIQNLNNCENLILKFDSNLDEQIKAVYEYQGAFI